MATLEEVRAEFSGLDIRTEIIDTAPTDGGEPVFGLNVWLGDQSARYPDDTIWPPVGLDGWVWGDKFQWGADADADAGLVVLRVLETVRTRG